MDKFFVYEGQTPVAVIDGADRMHIDDITRLAETLNYLFNRELRLKPIRPSDFPFERPDKYPVHVPEKPIKTQHKVEV